MAANNVEIDYDVEVDNLIGESNLKQFIFLQLQR